MARGAIALITIMAGLTAVVVLQYTATFASPDNVRSLEALVGNPAIRVLFGVPRALDQSGGFTVWRIGTFAAVAAAAWALTTATRLTRGQEDTGRAWLVLVGPLRLRSALAAHLLVIAAASILLGLATGLAMVAAGAGSRGAVVYATGITLVGLLFAAVGAARGQLLGERRIATGLSAGLLLVGLLVRMVADGIEWLSWTAWLTPFGLLSLSAPYAGDRWAPLGVLAGMAVVVGAVAWVLAGRRDVGSGLLANRQERPPRLRLLSSGWGFAVRRTWPASVGWSAALGAYFLLIGLLAISLTEFLEANPRFAELAAAAGFTSLATVQGYVASLLLLLPVPLGLFATTRVADLAQDEAAGRIPLLLSRPVGRIGWATQHVAVIAAACLGIAVLTGFAAWLGTRAVGSELTLRRGGSRRPQRRRRGVALPRGGRAGSRLGAASRHPDRLHPGGRWLRALGTCRHTRLARLGQPPLPLQPCRPRTSRSGRLARPGRHARCRRGAASASEWSASPVATYADEMRGVSSFPAQQQLGRLLSAIQGLEPAGRTVGS